MNYVTKKKKKSSLASFLQVELGGGVGALTVVDALDVAGLLLWSCVQTDKVSLVRLQSLCLFKTTQVILKAHLFMYCSVLLQNAML